MVLVKRETKGGYVRGKIIVEILNLSEKIKKLTNASNSYVWLDTPMPIMVEVEDKHWSLDYIHRIGDSKLYLRGATKPIDWGEVENRKLYLIWKRLKHNKAFVYKNIENTSMKVRVKDANRLRKSV